jgi:ketosteroid isomerase-like protein
MHPEMTWTVMATGVPGEGSHQGAEAIFQFILPMRALFAPGSPKITLRSLVSKGNLVMMETHGGGQLADGRSYDNQYVMALEVLDGKVVALREYMDSHYVNRLNLSTSA